MDPISEDDQQNTPTSENMHSSVHSKPQVSPRPRPGMPAGPRIRKATQNSTHPLTFGASPTTTNGRRFSSESSALSPDRSSPIIHSAESSQSSIVINERRHPPLSYTEDKHVQTDPIPTAVPVPPPRLPRTPGSTRPSTPAYKVVSKPITLPIPKPLNFETDPIAFRGLTLEAAQWTLTSDQLRNIVSTAIRDSAKESFIRILSTDTLEKEIPAESERLESLKATTQAQHRFHFHRRTNLLQSLNALATTIPVSDDGSNPLASLTSQLAEVVSAMDRFTETLLQVANQRAQIAQVQDVHLSSALAMALRKLNGSYEKRTTDLKKARSRIEELEAELDEAWKAAQDLAQEVDDLDHFEEQYVMDGRLDDDEEAAVERGGLMFEEDDVTTASVADAQLVGITGKGVSSKATLVPSPPIDGPPPFRKRGRSQSAPRTRSSSTGTDGGRSSKVLAARTRSSLASKASLRIPKSLSGAASGSDAGSISNISLKKRSRSKSNPKKPPSDTSSLRPAGPDSAKTNGHMINASFLELSRPGTPQLSSEDDIPPVPTLVNVVVEPKEEQAQDILVTEETQSDLKDDPQHTPGFDCSFIPPLSIKTGTQLLRPNSVDNGISQLGQLHLPPDSCSPKRRRIQSMQTSSINLPMLAIHDPANSDEDSPTAPGTSIPESLDDSRVIPDEPRRHPTECDKFDQWRWPEAKKLSSRPVLPVLPPPSSPTPSFLPELPPPPTDGHNNANTGSQRLKHALFRCKGRRNSMPLPSAAIAALLPWKGESRKRSSEPHLPSQGGRQRSFP